MSAESIETSEATTDILNIGLFVFTILFLSACSTGSSSLKRSALFIPDAPLQPLPENEHRLAISASYSLTNNDYRKQLEADNLRILSDIDTRSEYAFVYISNVEVRATYTYQYDSTSSFSGHLAGYVETNSSFPDDHYFNEQSHLQIPIFSAYFTHATYYEKPEKEWGLTSMMGLGFAYEYEGTVKYENVPFTPENITSYTDKRLARLSFHYVPLFNTVDDETMVFYGPSLILNSGEEAFQAFLGVQGGIEFSLTEQSDARVYISMPHMLGYTHKEFPRMVAVGTSISFLNLFQPD